jgi:hypothetical protein
MAHTKERPQPQELDTGERLATTGRAVLQGIAHEARGAHETEPKAHYRVDPAEAERIIEDWPDAQKNVARQMLAKYGPPNEATPTQLFWYRNGPWKRTVLTSDVVTHNWPTPHSDFLTQVIDYRVPPEKFDDIARFDGSILLDRTRGEVAARCDSEAASEASTTRARRRPRTRSPTTWAAPPLMPSACCSRCRRAAPRTSTRA